MNNNNLAISPILQHEDRETSEDDYIEGDEWEFSENCIDIPSVKRRSSLRAKGPDPRSIKLYQNEQKSLQPNPINRPSLKIQFGTPGISFEQDLSEPSMDSGEASPPLKAKMEKLEEVGSCLRNSDIFSVIGTSKTPSIMPSARKGQGLEFVSIPKKNEISNRLQSAMEE